MIQWSLVKELHERCMMVAQGVHCLSALQLLLDMHVRCRENVQG